MKNYLECLAGDCEELRLERRCGLLGESDSNIDSSIHFLSSDSTSSTGSDLQTRHITPGNLKTWILCCSLNVLIFTPRFFWRRRWDWSWVDLRRQLHLRKRWPRDAQVWRSGSGFSAFLNGRHFRRSNLFRFPLQASFSPARLQGCVGSWGRNASQSLDAALRPTNDFLTFRIFLRLLRFLSCYVFLLCSNVIVFCR